MNRHFNGSCGGGNPIPMLDASIQFASGQRLIHLCELTQFLCLVGFKLTGFVSILPDQVDQIYRTLQSTEMKTITSSKGLFSHVFGLK